MIELYRPYFGKVQPGQLFIKNKLSKKPAQAMEKLENIITSQERYDMSVTQNYSKNAVELRLLNKNNEATEPYQIKYIPVTSAAKIYEKTAQEMIKTAKTDFCNALSHKKSKPSLFERFWDYIDNMIK